MDYKENAKIWQGWLESIEKIPDEGAKGELALAIFRYALRGIKYTGDNVFVNIIMPTIEKSIDNSSRNAMNGSKGGLQKAANSGANSGANSDATSGALTDALSAATSTKDNRQKTIDKRQETKDIQNINGVEPSSPAPISSSKTKFNFKGYLIEHGASEQAVNDWLEVRKKKRAANTLSAINNLEREAEKAGISLAAAVEICAGNSWQSLKAEWVTQPAADSEESEYVKAMNAQIRRQREIDAELEAERQRRKREAANNNK